MKLDAHTGWLLTLGLLVIGVLVLRAAEGCSTSHPPEVRHLWAYDFVCVEGPGVPGADGPCPPNPLVRCVEGDNVVNAYALVEAREIATEAGASIYASTESDACTWWDE